MCEATGLIFSRGGGDRIFDLLQEHDVEQLERMQDQLKKATAMLGAALEREG